jgi:predicted ATPase
MAWQLIDEAFEAVEQIGDTFFLPELHRLKGELLLVLHGDRQDHAAACFQQALTIARSQDARLLELRAATSLARLYRQRDQHGDARVLLAPICGWFTEGLDLPDLQAAKGLLDPLRA